MSSRSSRSSYFNSRSGYFDPSMDTMRSAAGSPPSSDAGWRRARRYRRGAEYVPGLHPFFEDLSRPRDRHYFRGIFSYPLMLTFDMVLPDLAFGPFPPPALGLDITTRPVATGPLTVAAAEEIMNDFANHDWIDIRTELRTLERELHRQVESYDRRRFFRRMPALRGIVEVSWSPDDSEAESSGSGNSGSTYAESNATTAAPSPPKRDASEDIKNVAKEVESQSAVPALTDAGLSTGGLTLFPSPRLSGRHTGELSPRPSSLRRAASADPEQPNDRNPRSERKFERACVSTDSESSIRTLGPGPSGLPASHLERRISTGSESSKRMPAPCELPASSTTFSSITKQARPSKKKLGKRPAKRHMH